MLSFEIVIFSRYRDGLLQFLRTFVYKRLSRLHCRGWLRFFNETMNGKIYKYLKLIGGKRLPAPVKLLGLWAMHMFGKRTIGVFIDPVMACNLRCRMCYFSDPDKRVQMHGRMSDADLDRVEKALFHRALKLQIGCGAEPTLYPDLVDIVRRGRKAGVPYISLTTNGQLIATGKVSLMELVAAGLNELTLSLHGTDKETYEYLMPGADFENLQKLIEIVREVKKCYPSFAVRANFTVNSMNVDNLAGDRFWSLWGDGAGPDIVQLRPVQNLGKTEWTDFDHSSLKEKFSATIGAVADECRRRSITCLAPTLEQIDAVNDTQDAVSAIVEDLTYCYVSPGSCYKADFATSDSYESYHRRKHTARGLFFAAFKRNKARQRHVSKKLNYSIK